MSDTNTAVKTNDQGAATGDEGVKVETKVTTNQDAPLDTVVLLEKLRKAESDRDNYRAGLLKYKGKSKDDEDFDMEEFVKLKVQEELATRDASVTESDLKRLLKERDEAFTALKNRSQISTGQQGASTDDTNKVSDNVLSEQKVAQFKKMGWSDEKIDTYKQNLLKNRGFI